MEIVLVIINFIVLSIISNFLQNLYMKIVGADVMFFNGGKKLMIIFVLSVVLAQGGI